MRLPNTPVLPYSITPLSWIVSYTPTLHSSSFPRSDLPSLLAAKLSDQLPSVPTSQARIRRWEWPPSVPGRRCARPLPHSPREQIMWHLPPWHLRVPAHRHPSLPHRDGWPPA